MCITVNICKRHDSTAKQYSISFRENYASGVGEFYTSHGSAYRNPHAPHLRRVFSTMLVRWAKRISFHRTLDLACGSGEATEFLRDWFKAQNLDVIVGCFNTTAPELKKHSVYIEGSDPFTFEAYEERMHISAARYSFEDIEEGVLEGRQFDVVIGSYAMHLIDPSRLYSTCQQLAFSSKHLIIISPMKKPDIQESMGWNLEDLFTENKVHVRLYKSIYSSEV